MIHSIKRRIFKNIFPNAQMSYAQNGEVLLEEHVQVLVRPVDEELVREDVQLPYGVGFVRLRAEESVQIIKAARRRYHRHNQARRYVENEVWAALAASFRSGADAEDIRDALTGTPEIRAVLERMWPVLTPAQLLHDLFGSRALLKSAGQKHLELDEVEALYRERSEDLDDVRWTTADAALLDEARVYLGPIPGKDGKIDDADEIRTYGHIVIDEVQDLTPMQLAMVTRRSLSGSMTVVGDLAQATGAHAPATWDDVLDHLPGLKPSRVIGLSVGYRIPGQIMELANRVMEAANPGLRAPRAVREGVAGPTFASVSDPSQLMAEIVARTREMVELVNGGNVAVVVPDLMAEKVADMFAEAGVTFGRASNTALDNGITIVPVSVVKGLELDGVVVVEPSDIVEAEAQGMRSLYVALTRATQRLTVVHARPLPAPMIA
jgi:DNA helicase IV